MENPNVWLIVTACILGSDPLFVRREVALQALLILQA